MQNKDFFVLFILYCKSRGQRMKGGRNLKWEAGEVEVLT